MLAAFLRFQQLDREVAVRRRDATSAVAGGNGRVVRLFENVQFQQRLVEM